ncbi:HAMP domain-containing sensor histidine kinase [Micromonospora sp. NPDC050686]|uniref:HAMP domain-containing sensor histidine kinase n=1 Tax=Micromonospora sp. NPDC050686 TaxID=3154631 RepID=UPI0033CA32AA
MRRRLTLLVAATMCLVLLAFLVPLAVLLRRVAEERALVAATTEAQSLIALVGAADPAGLGLSAEQLAATSGRPMTVFLPDGTVLGTPAGRSPAVRLAATAGRSLTVAGPDGAEIVVAVRGRQDGNAVIRTFVPRAELTRGVARAWLVLAGLGVTLLLVGLAVADRLARTLIAPITELSAVSHRLAGAELTARARPAGPPELREVAGALNHLAERIQQLLQDEREQVADLSHRLRTPLTSLRLEAESLTDPAEAARVGARVDALERAVSGLIRQARWRRDGDAAAGCDAAAVVRDRVAFWSVLAEDTGRAVRLDLPPGPLPVRAPADELTAAVDALLGNVFAHTPDGTAFAVALRSRPGGGATLLVTDHGPGVPGLAEGDPGGPAAADGPDDGPVRRGASSAGSTGLGLDIARRAGLASGGGLSLAPRPGGGLRVTLELGPPRAFTSA